MLKILQINYKLNSSVTNFQSESIPVANLIANVPGLRWKFWVGSEAEREGGGIYLFEDEASLKSFVEGPIVAKLKAHSLVEEVSIKRFDVSIDLSAITRAPFEINSAF